MLIINKEIDEGHAGLSQNMLGLHWPWNVAVTLCLDSLLSRLSASGRDVICIHNGNTLQVDILLL